MVSENVSAQDTEFKALNGILARLSLPVTILQKRSPDAVSTDSFLMLYHECSGVREAKTQLYTPLTNKHEHTQQVKVMGPPVVMRPSMICSAALPPKAMQIMSCICSVDISRFSLGRYCANPRAAEPRGTMLTFNKGSAHRRNHAETACPASWKATVLRSSALMTYTSKDKLTQSPREKTMSS